MTLWHAFGSLGHWTEWHASAKTMRELLADIQPKVHAYGHAFVQDPTGQHTWFISKSVGFSKREIIVKPYKPLQSDWGVEEP